MRNVLRFFLGYFRITFTSSDSKRILNYLLKRNVPVWQIQSGEALSFCILPFHRKHLIPFQKGIRPEESYSEERLGILPVLSRFSKRWGLFAGGFFFVFCLLISGRFVWGIEVEGNETISEQVILEWLEEAGLRVGKNINDLDKDSFSLRFQAEHPQVTYASLNFIGTKAVFSVREKEEAPEQSRFYEGTCNMVASISGRIVRYEVLSGQSVVKRGEAVRKGDLLISGIVERKNGSFRIVAAKGRVFAETNRYFEVKIPYLETKIVYTGLEKAEKNYEILGFSTAVFTKREDPYDVYFKTEKREPLTCFHRLLPIVCHEVTYHQMEEKNTVLTVDIARKKAYDKYDEYKGEVFAPGYEILQETVTFEEEEDGLWMRVEIVAVENIVEVLPFQGSGF